MKKYKIDKEESKIKNKRWSNILELCEKQSAVTVYQLVEALNVSEATIRRDLQSMEDEHLIVRFHGGARIIDAALKEKTMSMKSLLNVEEKEKISRFGASLIQDGQIVFLDAGTTTYSLIDYIKAKDITVVTTGIPHLTKLAQKNIKTFALSGFVKPSTAAVTGKETVHQISNMNFDIALLGTNGIHSQAGFTTTEEYEGEAKEMAIQQAKKSYVLADKSKFNKLCFVRFAHLNEATVVIDEKVADFDYNLIDYIIAQ